MRSPQEGSRHRLRPQDAAWRAPIYITRGRIADSPSGTYIAKTSQGIVAYPLANAVRSAIIRRLRIRGWRVRGTSTFVEPAAPELESRSESRPNSDGVPGIYPSTPSRRRHNSMSTRKNWPAIIDRLNNNSKGSVSIKMGSPGSAQVTRCRLLEQWNGLEVRTVGSTLHLSLSRP